MIYSKHEDLNKSQHASVKLYKGKRLPSGDHVVTDSYGNALDARQDLYNHSPTGFSWGYSGSGPAQLALAILADYFSNDVKALQYYHDFKWRVIAGIHTDEWILTGQEIDAAMAEIERDLPCA
jgi:hypothetical protein